MCVNSSYWRLRAVGETIDFSILVTDAKRATLWSRNSRCEEDRKLRELVLVRKEIEACESRRIASSNER